MEPSTHSGRTYEGTVERVGRLFSEQHMDTAEIARLIGENEATVVRMLAQWRERKREAAL